MFSVTGNAQLVSHNLQFPAQHSVDRDAALADQRLAFVLFFPRNVDAILAGRSA
jgi:hypothetical protein